MAHHKCTASTPACVSHLSCEFQQRWLVQWHAPHFFHIVWNIEKNPMSHIERLHASPPLLPHAVALCKPHLGGLTCFINRQAPTPLWILGSKRSDSLFGNPWDISSIHLSLKVQMTWPRLKAASLGQKTIVLHSVRGNNMIWLGPQSQLLTFHPWHKYYLAWYLSPLNVHCCKAPPNIFWGSSVLMLMAILMIPTTTSINLGNLNLVFTTRFSNPT